MSLTEILPQLFSGTMLTINLMLLSLVVGFLLALIMTLLLESKKVYFALPIKAWIFMIRGTPLLVQIFIIYYGSDEFIALHHTFLWDLLKHPFGCAVTALALNTSAYTTVLLCSAIHSIPAGEVEACHALGLSRGQMYRRIIFPRAFRLALPAYSNEVVMILKGTSLASTITLMDLMGVISHWIAVTYQTIPLLIIAGIVYLILNTFIMGAFKLLERRISFPKTVSV